MIGLDRARERFGTTVDRFAELLRVGDPLADAVVDAYAVRPPGSAKSAVERALREGVRAVPDAPEALRALFDELERVPAWVDREALERGGELLFRAGWFGGLALGTSLVLGYASPGGNKPLMASGRLTQQAARRLVETSRFVEAVCLPGGLARHADGFAITVKVRVMHAQVRRMLLRSGWDVDAWGVPINQHDMSGTAILFSYAVIDSLEKLGFRFDPVESDLYMQLWRYANHLVGVHPEVLPTSAREAKRYSELIQATEGPPDDDSRALSRALFTAAKSADMSEAERRRAQRLAPLGQGIIRGMLGDVLADQLDVPKHAWRHAFPVLRGLVSRLDLASQRSAAVRASLVRQGHAYWSMVSQGNRTPIDFAPPEVLPGLERVLARAA
jgi:hypothetical protein